MTDGIHSAADVAKWLLRRNNDEMELDDADYITNMKLQKLLYYAQGTFLGMTGKPLFADELFAWTHGPVVPSVYREYSQYKKNGIPYTENPQEHYSDEENELLEQVYCYFGQYAAWKLRSMTHNERPWKSTKHNDVIPLDVIRDFFKEEYVDESA